jgi:hypothetical protein
MYLFDLEDFYNSGVCGANMTKTTPSQWEDVFTTFRSIIDYNSKSFNDYYLEEIANFPASDCKNKIIDLYNEWFVFVDYEPIGPLRQALADLESSLVNGTFDQCGYTEWNAYMDAFNQNKELQRQIVFLLDTNCDVQAYDFNTCSEITTITDEKPVTSKCCGIYIKRIDIGSEFRGTVTDSNSSSQTSGGISIVNN